MVTKVALVCACVMIPSTPGRSAHKHASFISRALLQKRSRATNNNRIWRILPVATLKERRRRVVKKFFVVPAVATVSRWRHRRRDPKSWFCKKDKENASIVSFSIKLKKHKRSNVIRKKCMTLLSANRSPSVWVRICADEKENKDQPFLLVVMVIEKVCSVSNEWFFGVV